MAAKRGLGSDGISYFYNRSVLMIGDNVVNQSMTYYRTIYSYQVQQSSKYGGLKSIVSSSDNRLIVTFQGGSLWLIKAPFRLGLDEEFVTFPGYLI